MDKKIGEGRWVKKYRLWLLVLLAAVVIWLGWYCILSFQRSGMPEDATLVQEVITDEREA